MSPDARAHALVGSARRRLPAGSLRGARPLSAAEWRSVLRRTALGFVRHGGVDAAAALTTFGALALFPIALALLSALALVTGSTNAVDAILDLARQVTRDDSVAALRGPLLQLGSLPAPGVALAIGLAGTVWTVSAYAACFGRVLNEFYEVEEGRPAWRSRGAMVVLSLPLIVAGAVVFALVLLTPELGQALAFRTGTPPAVATAFQIVKWPVIGGLLALMLGALYLWTPNVERRMIGIVSYGAGLAIAGCVVASAGFALYVGTIGHYDAVYGWLGGALVLLIQLYLIDLVLVIGASLDTEIVRMRQLRAGIAAERRIRVPLRDTTREAALTRWVAGAEAEGRAIRLSRVDATQADGGPGGYRRGMQREQPEGTPSEEAVEEDFTVPDDADLKPIDPVTGDVEDTPTEPADRP